LLPPSARAGADVSQLTDQHVIVVQELMQTPGGAGGVIVDMATGSTRSFTPSVQAINDSGWAVLDVFTVAHNPSTAFEHAAMLLRPDASIRFGSGGATGINNAGVVVGTLDVGAFLWTSGGISLLDKAAVDPAWIITAADKINNRGQILAQADNTDGRKGHWVILTPVAH
jgi:hypothetical protein